MKKKRLIIIVIVFVLLMLSIFYLHFENNELQISSYVIFDDEIPIEFNDYKIIQISDFHNSKSKKLTNKLIEEIKGKKPNIIVITGDLIDANRTDIDVAINLIKNLKDIAPIYFISGNHEASISEYSVLIDKLLSNDVIILDNKTEILRINESQINLIGIDDPLTAHESVVSDSEIVKNYLIKSNYNKDYYSILLSHRPEVFNTYVENNINLVLSGHAHGGQIRLPFIGGLVAPNQGIFPKYTSGTFEEEKTTMIVSRGIGNSILPFRINNRPELVIVKLKTR